MSTSPSHKLQRHLVVSQFDRVWHLVTGGTSFSDLPVRRKVVLSQLPMFLAVLFTCVIAQFSNRDEIFGDYLFIIGLVLVAASTVASGVVPWDKFRYEFTYLVIPSFGFIAASFISIGASQWLTGLTLLAGFPIFWFAWSGACPRITLALSFLVPFATAILQLVHHGIPFTVVTVIRPILVPVLLLALATTTVIAEYNTTLKDSQLRSTLADSKRQADLLNAILNAANVGLVVVDRDGNDVLMNEIQRVQHLHAIPQNIEDPTEAQLLVRRVLPNYEPDTSTMAPSDRPVLRAINRHEFSDELIALGPLEDPRYHSTSARGLFDESGAHDGAVVVFKDVSEMVEASKTKDRFLANVSHELRTPLTSIMGYLEILEDDPHFNTKTRNSLGVISRNTDRLLNMVNDLLAAAAGKHKLASAPLDLGALIATRLESLIPRAATAGIELSHGPLNHEQVHGDSLRLGQVIDNLVTNAIKYSNAGDSVRIEMESDSAQIRFTVIDTGHGISVDAQKEIFTRFFRSEEARRSGLPGVGLGLAITKELVESHGGNIALSSELSQGTRVIVSIPRHFPGQPV
ncbi:hypothetical protein CQ018_15585 [Arthrobacter sp. MYb227]|uniref:sensor histidine kinase n=1 Tax=Arthrobacter sp. MYb227 TaxID=1848601 RepID=UPI000CFAAF36|nr:PAS domain-containing sensor histidine kinase [Arthrobacter sp. MYb227]PQZ89570.1 hypothetical protein CQ018_15585 [Arthrobacter sp. MYb227]